MASFVFSLVWVIAVMPGQTAAGAIGCGTFLLGAAIGTEAQSKEQNPNSFIAMNYGYMVRLIAGFFVILITSGHSFAPKIALRIQNSMAILKMIVLLLVLICGLVVACNWHPTVKVSNNFSDAWEGSKFNINNVVSNFFTILFVFDGWAAINYSLDELIDPINNLPKVSFFSMSICLIITMLATVSYYVVIPKESIINKKNGEIGLQFFTLVFGKIFGQTIMSILISLSAFSTVMCLCFAASRLSFECAKEGYFHPKICKIMSRKSKYNSPHFALFLHCFITLIFIFGPPPGDTYVLLVQMTSYPQWIFYGLSVAGLLVMRFTKPALARPVEAPALVPASFVFFCFAMMMIPFVPPPKEDWTYSYSYLLVPALGITVIVVCLIWWYIQVIVFKGLENSFNAQFARSHKLTTTSRSVLIDRMKFYDVEVGTAIPLLNNPKKNYNAADLFKSKKSRDNLYDPSSPLSPSSPSNQRLGRKSNQILGSHSVATSPMASSSKKPLFE